MLKRGKGEDVVKVLVVFVLLLTILYGMLKIFS
jgi:hypothetical protein